MAERVGEFRCADHLHREVRLFVELTDLFIEGWCRSTRFKDDQFTYVENVRKVVGKRTRRGVFDRGQGRVILDRIDERSGSCSFR